MEILEITPTLKPQVCTLLSQEIGRGISTAEFSAVFEARWAPGPVGFAIVNEGRVVGALATIRSARVIRGRMRQFCNLSSWAVTSPFRSYAPALLQRATSLPDTIFTNFTASAAVAGVLRAFGFAEMPVGERVLLPLPFRTTLGAKWIVDLDTIESTLRTRGHDEPADHVRDHRGTLAKWVLVDFGDECNVVALHLMHVRHLPFAYVLYCSTPHRFEESLTALRKACARTWGRHLIAWPRARLGTASGTIAVKRPHPVLYKGDDVTTADLVGLYTELTLLPILR